MNTTIDLSENILEVIRGTSKTLELEVLNEDDEAVDITGARVILTAKRTLQDPHPLFQKSSTDVTQALITSPRAGRAEIYIKPADTHNLESNFDYLYDVWVILASGERFAVIPLSILRVQDAVTRVPL